MTLVVNIWVTSKVKVTGRNKSSASVRMANRGVAKAKKVQKNRPKFKTVSNLQQPCNFRSATQNGGCVFE